MTPAPSLAELEADCWQQLATALAQKQNRTESHGFQTMTVATCTHLGADARTVVLRQVDTDRKYVWFHTDARAEKVIQLEAFPNAVLLLWDPAQQIQLRLTIEPRLHTDDHVADDHWQKLWVGGRKQYLSAHTPGSVQPAPYPGFPPELGENLPSPEESEAGRTNFAVIECRVLAVDYLRLSRAGQTRARFEYEPNERFSWLAP
ncbi:pyridoxamine 5'-phosphate oxidase family protein [Spirosoma lacussanchae]|uniref:pyridoxamine 5'-phosphate oxidase family protein n=1 Tax=Spirosoma lacussanchae TaxID=1884249 RepID=UPI0011087B33|nr:pyridoxamine 5'-phosphate oxidase family protein [Spirosoma lacussanchae]